MTTPETEIALLGAHLGHVREDISEMRVSMDAMAKAITTLTAIETKQTEHSQAIGRAFNEIGEVRSRVMTLELAQPMAKQTQGIVSKAVEMILVAVLGALLALVVIKPSDVKPAVIQAAPVTKGGEAQSHGATK